MQFLKRLNPVPGVKDFWGEIRRPNPHRWPVLGASMAITGSLFYAFASERTYIPPASPEVTYITSFAPDRTDQEIMASNLANQQRRDALTARLQEREELRRSMYRELGRATGIDVDTIEAEAEAERARAEAEERQRQAELMGRTVADTTE